MTTNNPNDGLNDEARLQQLVKSKLANFQLILDGVNAEFCVKITPLEFLMLDYIRKVESDQSIGEFVSNLMMDAEKNSNMCDGNVT